MKKFIEPKKVVEFENIGTKAEYSKYQFEAFRLSKVKAELSLKALPYTNQCMPKSEIELGTCSAECTKQKDRDACLKGYSLPLKAKSEKHLDKLADKPTGIGSENTICTFKCRKNSHYGIIDCQYSCHKNEPDA
jgi:hypothetical protein